MTPADVRQRLLAALEADLVGPFIAESLPGGGQEVLPLPPSRWYLTGFLAPQFDCAPDADDTDAVGDLAAGSDSQAEDAGKEEIEAKRPHRFPASMGLSVFLPAPPAGTTIDHIEVELAYAEYVMEDIAEDNEKKARVGWRRVPCAPPKFNVPLDPRVLGGPDGFRWPEATGLRIRGEIRDTDIDGLPPGARVLSLFLVNERPPLDRDRDLNFIFQVRFALRYPHGFLARPNRRGEDGNDNDQRILALTFRDRFEWAVGHNTSVDIPRPDQDGTVRELRTTQIPRYEVCGVRHEDRRDKIGIEITEMRQYAGLDGPGLVRALSPLVEAYGAWIERQRYAPLRETLVGIRDPLMVEAEGICKRIREGIELLAADGEVREAFKLANLAMHAQALQADRWREDKRYKDGAQPRWRPFQLAFILLNLASVADPKHEDRGVADLIYFPTGGGKTEAYLGLIAFTLILRRLRGKARPDEGRGVAVILRYTLRLLTLDQLGRAATLMCALEELRRRDPKRLGNARFAVGLWVGQSATANRLKEVHAALHDFTPGRTDSPFPLTTCPWCGEDIKIHNIKLVDDDGKPSKTKFTRAVVYCEGRDCLYTEQKRPGQGLPVLFVDEQIYKELPDFLVATVDTQRPREHALVHDDGPRADADGSLGDRGRGAVLPLRGPARFAQRLLREGHSALSHAHVRAGAAHPGGRARLHRVRHLRRLSRRRGLRGRAEHAEHAEHAARCSALRDEAERALVHVDELAGLDVAGVVDATRGHIAGVALREHDRLAVGEQAIRAFAEELNDHLALHDDGHVVARVRVGRFGGARLPALEHHLHAIRVLGERGAQGEALRGAGDGDVMVPDGRGRSGVAVCHGGSFGWGGRTLTWVWAREGRHAGRLPGMVPDGSPSRLNNPMLQMAASPALRSGHSKAASYRSRLR